jgi:hypothetical protein
MSSWLALPIGLSALVFYPILRNYFFGDDLYNLYQIVNAPLGTYLLTPYGGHVLVARNFVFFLCHQLFGTQASGYFWLMLLTHLLNVALLFDVVRLLSGSARLACFGAALWGSAPLQEGSLGWYSVYGNVMAGTVALWLLRDLARAMAGRPLTLPRLLLWPVLIVIGCTSFGVGLAVALVLPVLVVLMHPGRASKAAALLCSALIAITVLPAYFAVHRLMLTPEAAAIATSTLNLGTLTVWQPMLGMLANLAGYGLFSLALRDVTTRVPYVPGIGIALIGVLALVFALGGARGDRRTRNVLLACTILALATFGVVVAGRGVLWGEKFYLATRYQYLPLIGVVIGFCLALAALDKAMRVSETFKNAALGLWVVGAIVVHLTLSPGIDHHDNARRATDIEVSEMRRLIRATAAGHDVFITNRVFHGVGPMLIRNPKVFPGWAAAFAIFFPSNVVDGRPVFFVEADTEVRDAARDGRRTASLIVPSGNAR